MAARRSPSLRSVVRAAFWLAAAAMLARAIWPDPFTEPYVGMWDKAAHGAAFYVLTLFAAAAYPRTSYWVIAAGMVLFGGLIELLQAIPAVHRDASLGDILADLVGIVAALSPTAVPAVRAALRRR